jgi:RHS repeat-associated protein
VIAQAGDDQGVGNFYSYTPYGEVQVLADDQGNPIQYTGRENDQTGLYYYRARYYDPKLKRFIAEDPSGSAGGLNLYGYVGGDPVSKRDPTGLSITVCDDLTDTCYNSDGGPDQPYDPGSDIVCDDEFAACLTDAGMGAGSCLIWALSKFKDKNAQKECVKAGSEAALCAVQHCSFQKRKVPFCPTQ